MSELTRRQMLKTTGTALFAASSIGVVGTAKAESEHPHLDVPEHVTVSDDPADIEPWLPRLVDADGGEVAPTGQYALRASSPEYDTDCIVTWTQYPYQRGVSGYDSHAGDHEPVYVFVDKSTGDVTEVFFSAYHWARGATTPTGIKLVDTTDGQQPVLRVVNPWHHYLPVPTGSDYDGKTYELASLDDEISAWLTNGLDESLAVTQPYDPWGMRARSHWWRSTTGNEIDHTLVTSLVSAGLGNIPGIDIPTPDEAGL